MLPNKIHKFDDAILDRQIEELCFHTRDGWEDLKGDLGAARVPGSFTTPTWAAFSGDHYAWLFSNSVNQGLQVTWHVSHRYKPDTKIFPHIHFAALGGGAGVVRFIVDIIPMRGYDQLTAIPSNIVTTLDFNVTADSPHIILEATDAQSFDTELEVDSLLSVVMYRDTSVADNYSGGNIFGLFCDGHIEIDRFSTPGRNFPFYDTLLR